MSGKRQMIETNRAGREHRSRPHRFPSGTGIILTVALLFLLVLSFWLLLPSGSRMVASSLEAIPLRVKVLSVRPHDPQAFTQGLLLHNGSLYESTGLYGRSSLRRTHPLTGEILRRVYLTPDLFGEGLERVGDRLIQLTWREQTAFVYNLNTFERMGEFTYAGEGWGLCFDDHQLIMSDGTEVITFRDPDSFAATGQIKVTLNGLPLLPRFKRLNELEWAEGWIYANVWLTDTIFRINPQNGQVTATIDASGLLSNEERLRADVLNGIAYDPEKGTFLITGKYWPKIFEVVFVPAESQSAGKL